MYFKSFEVTQKSIGLQNLQIYQVKKFTDLQTKFYGVRGNCVCQENVSGGHIILGNSVL